MSPSEATLVSTTCLESGCESFRGNAGEYYLFDTYHDCSKPSPLLVIKLVIILAFVLL